MNIKMMFFPFSKKKKKEKKASVAFLLSSTDVVL